MAFWFHFKVAWLAQLLLSVEPWTRFCWLQNMMLSSVSLSWVYTVLSRILGHGSVNPEEEFICWDGIPMWSTKGSDFNNKKILTAFADRGTSLCIRKNLRLFLHCNPLMKHLSESLPENLGFLFLPMDWDQIELHKLYPCLPQPELHNLVCTTWKPHLHKIGNFGANFLY